MEINVVKVGSIFEVLEEVFGIEANEIMSQSGVSRDTSIIAATSI
jgi:hypothetical protein